MLTRMYKTYSQMIERLAYRFSKTTGVEESELFAHAWAKLTYAIKFFNEQKSSEKTFVYMVAKTAMTEIWQEQKKEIHTMAVSYDALTSNLDDENHDTSAILFTDNLSKRDNYVLAELAVDVSAECLDLAKAIIEDGLESQNQIYAWGKSKGMRRNHVSYLIFELKLVLTGNKVNHHA